jgi:hypothetical protein
MATINVNDLNSIGSDLFADSESYLQELSDLDLNIQGGGVNPTLWKETFTTSF